MNQIKYNLKPVTKLPNLREFDKAFGCLLIPNSPNSLEIQNSLCVYGFICNDHKNQQLLIVNQQPQNSENQIDFSYDLRKLTCVKTLSSNQLQLFDSSSFVPLELKFDDNNECRKLQSWLTNKNEQIIDQVEKQQK